ncbi:MAG: cadmium-translocating P-type ATPase [Deinococcota bacterium]|nr:cadmium-translocating P-type ATPase [Deinococcota bacterium]
MSHAASLPSSSATPVRLLYRVGGMDCPSCVSRVEGAARRVAGVMEVRSNHLTQTLELRLDEAQTPRAALEARLRKLGHPLVLARDGNTASGPVPAQRPWFRSGEGRQALLLAGLIALAFALSLAEPGAAHWGFVAATLFGVWPLAKKAVAATRAGDPFSINTLVSLAALGALVIGEAAEGAVVVFFFMIGEFLEGIAASRARRCITALAALTPKTAQLLDDGGPREVAAASLRVGQRVRVAPGARVPADGTVVEGSSHLDESPVTGESVPVYKERGASVFAGSINAEGVLTLEVTHGGEDNTLARILHLVEQAEATKAPTARFINRFSRVYTPVVVLVAALTALLPPLLVGAAWDLWLYRGLALLLIGCPCALVLSVPAAITSATSAGARRGLLVKGGAVLETLSRVTTVAFDKTGTLTEGRPVVTDVMAFGVGDAELLRLSAALEATSQHPLARAIVARAKENGLVLPEASNARALAGKAVVGEVEGHRLTVASPRYAGELAPLDPSLLAHIRRLEEEGKTVVVSLAGERVLGLLALRDEPRADAQEALAKLRGRGLKGIMLTGDNRRTAQAIAGELGLDVYAELLPADKHDLVLRLHDTDVVAMVGDGINDAPALAQADVGIAMAGGTDVALETAHAALLRPRLMSAVDLIALSQATMNTIRLNIAFALGLKAIFLITTLLGVTGLWAAILADTGATALVTANALRLLRFKGEAS